MERIIQTELHDPANGSVGNCWSACIAMVTERPIETVPHFIKDHGSWWWVETKKWLQLRDLTLMRFLPLYDRTAIRNGEPVGGELDPKKWWDDCIIDDEPGAALIMTGLSPRSPVPYAHPDAVLHSIVTHRVVGQRIDLDPHPSNDGIGQLHDVAIVMPYRK